MSRISFESLGLAPELVKAVEEQGYTEPTPIQQEAIPMGLAGKDVVGSAQTGTGKTAAFLLPILQRLDPSERGVFRALILTPTRELAEQVLQAVRAYGCHTGKESVAIYGGVPLGPQTRALRRGIDIVVATPGRLLDHMSRGHVDSSKLEFLVLDEADRMLDMGFAPDVMQIIDSLPSERQTMCFSATISSEVDRLARRALRQHAEVEIGRRAEVAEGVEHIIVAVDKADKRKALLRMLQEVPENGRTLVFTRTKHGADKLAFFLRREGLNVSALHGDKSQDARDKALARFKNGKVSTLVATDVAARGIDVTDILMVVNYDVPHDPEIYVHRVGRTARAGGHGVGLTLMSPDEWILMRDVEKLMGRSFRRDVMPGMEPDIMPLQPEERAEALKRPARSVMSRRGGRGGRTR